MVIKLPSLSNTLLIAWFSWIFNPVFKRSKQKHSTPSHPRTLACRSVQQAFSLLQAWGGTCRLLNQDIKLQSSDPRWLFKSTWNGSDPVWGRLKLTIQGCLWEVPRSILDNQNEQRCSFHQAIKNKSKPWVVFGGTPPALVLSIPTFHHPSPLAWQPAVGGLKQLGAVRLCI